MNSPAKQKSAEGKEDSSYRQSLLRWRLHSHIVLDHPHNEGTDFTGQECWWLTAQSNRVPSSQHLHHSWGDPWCKMYGKTGRFRSIESHPSSEFRSTLKSYHSSKTSHRISWSFWYDWTTAQLCPNHSAFYTLSQVLIQKTHPSQPPTCKSEFASLENPT